jgi:hypothetical protein
MELVQIWIPLVLAALVIVAAFFLDAVSDFLRPDT